MPIAKYAETQRKWVEKNPEYFKEYSVSYFQENKEQYRIRKNKSNAWLREAKIFRNILIDLIEFIEIA
jgi:hypothetical protein